MNLSHQPTTSTRHRSGSARSRRILVVATALALTLGPAAMAAAQESPDPLPATDELPETTTTETIEVANVDDRPPTFGEAVREDRFFRQPVSGQRALERSSSQELRAIAEVNDLSTGALRDRLESGDVRVDEAGRLFDPSEVDGAPDTLEGLDLERDRRLDNVLDDLSGAQARQLADFNGRSASELDDLARDDSLRVAPSGRLFYVDPGSSTADSTEADTDEAPPFPLSQTFQLHSKPGSSKTIYLDFDGYTLPGGTGWLGGAGYNAPAMDTAGNGPGFTNAELELVQGVWQRVAEDFAPFDVNVTTQYPGYAAINRSSGADSVFGTRAVITDGDPAAAGFCGGCGGIAYVGVFDLTGATHDFYQPAWVFSSRLAQDEKNIAEATTHEVGHNLDLVHDGTNAVSYYTGHDKWAPIMGVGYSRPVTQFSQGDYPGANNGQDDFAIIDGTGLDYRPDDHTSTNIYARARETGIVERRNDYDEFRFQACGRTTVSATPAPVSPNLDARVYLYTDTYSLLGSSTPTTTEVNRDRASGMDASVSANLTYGDWYRVRVYPDGEGTWNNGYDTYGSRGAYELAVERPAGDCDAWTVLDRPGVGSYTVSHDRWHNPSGGGAPTVNRTATGTYTVNFPGMAILGGVPNVTSMTPGTTCNVQSWGTSAVNVRCWDANGNAADAQVSLLWTFDSNDAFAWAHDPSAASYTPSTFYANNPEGGVEARRTGVGRYAIEFEDFAPAGGNPQVNAYASTAVFCTVSGWSYSTGTVYVGCHDSSGTPTDSRYSITFTGADNDGWLWANNATAASYTPSGTYSNNPTGGAITVERSGTGTYKATFADGEWGRGNVQVNAYGGSWVSCAVTAWSNSSALVRCSDDAGQPVNTLFSLRHSAGAPLVCQGRAVTVDLHVGDVPTGGDDVVLGTQQADYIPAGSGNDRVCAEGGNDTVNGGQGHDRVLGGSGADRIVGHTGNDRLSGGSGNDDISGRDGRDTIQGNDGHDVLRGDGGRDTIFGDEGRDLIIAGGGHDVVRAGNHRDDIRGSGGNDQLFGEGGPDRLRGQSGTDQCNGGSGVDVAGADCEVR